jgi:uncharacterized protein
MTSPLLQPLEARILAVLVEKQKTVPDTYPLSLNALASGCNQKTSRDPVMNASESELLPALEQLKELKFVAEQPGGRVTRYSHQMGLVLKVPAQAIAILTVLMLRGPQTAGELRLNCERLHRFADISAVEAFLQELAERADGALVQELPRAPGSRENRWAHTLCGEVNLPDIVQVTSAPASGLAQRVATLEAEVAELRAELEDLKRHLDQR